MLHTRIFKWPILIKGLKDDGFGGFDGTRIDVEYWITQFSSLRSAIKIDKCLFGARVEYMDLDTYKGSRFYDYGITSKTRKQMNRYKKKFYISLATVATQNT